MICPQQPDYDNNPADIRRANYGYVRQRLVTPVSVSILTAYFNTDAVFLETATFILGQSFQEWEWILVDDGSTDRVNQGWVSGLAAHGYRVSNYAFPEGEARDDRYVAY